MLSNAYFLAKFRFDTAENEPAKNLQNFANLPISSLAEATVVLDVPDVQCAGVLDPLRVRVERVVDPYSGDD